MKFFDIRKLAIKYFYEEDDGEDFLWLKRNFHKFNIQTIGQAKEFLPTLRFIYSNFLLKAHNHSTLNVNQYGASFKIDEHELQIIKNHLNTTWEILLDAFEGPYELNREFASIIINHTLAHPASLEYLYKIASEVGYKRIEYPPPF